MGDRDIEAEWAERVAPTWEHWDCTLALTEPASRFGP